MRATGNRTASMVASLIAALLILSGQVTDATTGQPMPGIHLSLVGPSRVTTTTHADGKYLVRGLRAGTYVVTLTSSDVPPVTRRVTVRTARTTKNFIVCSMTLDYSCRNALPGGPG